MTSAMHRLFLWPLLTLLQVEVPVFKEYLVPTMEAQGMQVTTDKTTNDATLNEFLASHNG